MENKNVTVGCGGLPMVLFIVFLVLKLVGVISWSWVWVLAPLWIPIALAICIGLIGLLVCGIVLLVNKIRGNL